MTHNIIAIFLCTVLICVCVIAGCASTNTSISASPESTDLSSDAESTGLSSDAESTGLSSDAESTGLLSEAELSELQLQKLEELEKDGMSYGCGHFIFQEEVIKGNADPQIERMTLDEVEKIIAECDSFEEIMASLEARQKFPDFSGGSGISKVEYWLDPSGNKKIFIIMEQGQIYYDHVDESGSPLFELLYDWKSSKTKIR